MTYGSLDRYAWIAGEENEGLGAAGERDSRVMGRDGVWWGGGGEKRGDEAEGEIEMPID